MRYGLRSTCQLDASALRVASPSRPIANVDPLAAMRRALAEPVDFPPLAQATVPGDRAVVAVADGVPQRAAIALGALTGLVDAGVDVRHTTVLLQSELEDPAAFRRELAARKLADVQLAVHDPADAQQLAMVGVTEAGRPLRMNRLLAEADLTLPIAGRGSELLAPEAAARYAGLYPQFADLADQRRFHAPDSDRPKSLPQRSAEIEEAGWLMGVVVCAQAVPGAAGGVAAVFAGAPASVAAAAGRCRDATWACRLPHRGDLALAAIAGDAETQSWNNLACAVETARSAVVSGGAVAVCCDLEEPPGPAVHQLRDALDWETASRRILRERSADSRAALLLVRALARGPVYLLSRLAASTVEALGMTPIAGHEELNRLIRSYQRPLLLEDAPFLQPRGEGVLASP
jgi:hypothetical protein